MRKIDIDFLLRDLAKAEAILEELQPQVKQFHDLIDRYLKSTEKRRYEREGNKLR
jgi:hypothetical protein